MHILIVSDIYIPSRTPKLPTDVRTKIKSVSHTIYSGDIGSSEALHNIQQLAEGELTAVCGDKDPADIDLPAVATVHIEGISFVVVHTATSSNERLTRIAETVIEHGGADAIGVTGHTHEPADQVADGVRILNP